MTQQWDTRKWQIHGVVVGRELAAECPGLSATSGFILDGPPPPRPPASRPPSPPSTLSPGPSSPHLLISTHLYSSLQLTTYTYRSSEANYSEQCNISISNSNIKKSLSYIFRSKIVHFPPLLDWKQCCFKIWCRFFHLFSNGYHFQKLNADNSTIRPRSMPIIRSGLVNIFGSDIVLTAAHY